MLSVKMSRELMNSGISCLSIATAWIGRLEILIRAGSNFNFQVRILVQGQCNVISNQFELLNGTLKH